MHSIKMSNISQNNGVESINQEVSFLQDRLKINEKSLNQISKRGKANWKITIKTRTKDKSS